MRDTTDEPELAFSEARQRRILIRPFAVGVIALLVCLAAPFAWDWIVRKGTAIHHRAITRELAEWEREVSQIHTPEDAAHARGMLEYVRNYYVVAPGNRSDPETEAELESQREKTIGTIEHALKEYEASRETAPKPADEHKD